MKKNEIEKKPHLARWEVILVLVSLIVSTASLYFSFYSYKRNEEINSSPNIQIMSSLGERSHNIIDSTHSTFSISCSIVIKNIGSAPAQIIDAKWESMFSGDSMHIEDAWLALSDKKYSKSTLSKDYFYQNRTNPILGITNKTILSDETKTIQMVFFAKNVLSKKHNIPNIRLTFVFNNGEQRTIIPEMELKGVGGVF